VEHSGIINFQDVDNIRTIYGDDGVVRGNDDVEVDAISVVGNIDKVDVNDSGTGGGEGDVVDSDLVDDGAETKKRKFRIKNIAKQYKLNTFDHTQCKFQAERLFKLNSSIPKNKRFDIWRKFFANYHKDSYLGHVHTKNCIKAAEKAYQKFIK
jgi:hypothetical protein